MLELIIPSLALHYNVAVSCTEFTNWRDCQQETQSMMETDVVKYADRDYIMAHDYLFFEPIKKLRKNQLIIFNNTRYRVKDILFINKHDTWVLNYNGLSLQTCDGAKTRIVQAEIANKRNKR